VLGRGTVQRVLQAAADLGYEPDLLARALRTQRSFNVGVLMPDPDDPSVLPLLRGIEDGLAAAGYAALIAGPADRAAVLVLLQRRLRGGEKVLRRADRRDAGRRKPHDGPEHVEDGTRALRAQGGELAQPRDGEKFRDCGRS